MQNQVQIDYDNDNEDCYDYDGDNFDDYGDENYQTPDKYNSFLVKIYSFEALLLGEKGPKQPCRGQPPPPLNGQCPFKIIFLIWMSSLILDHDI